MAKKRFASQLITRSISQTASELENHFGGIEDLIHAVTAQYGSGFWDQVPQEKVLLHSISLVENYAPVSSIGIADGRGYEFNVIPDSISGYWLIRRVFVDRWGYTARWERWRLEDTLTRIDRWEESLPADPRDRPWYTGATQAGSGIYWTTPYPYTTSADIGMTAASRIPHRDQVDSLSRIVALDLTLHDLNNLIDDLQLTSQQNVYLLTSDNQQIITSNADRVDRDDSVGLSSAVDNPVLAEVLNAGIKSRAFRFEEGGKSWWGILNPYDISQNRQINIVSVLPEEDFAREITRTLWIGVGSFFLILMSSFVVVSNHNKLHRISNTLSRKNKLISKQKQFLFSEVHHRVKNNLALISAFLELEILNMDDASTSSHLQKNQRRIKIIAIIQEEVYRSSDLGSVTAEAMISGILRYLERKTPDTVYELATDEIRIDVNQALTYGLLINELLNSLNQLDTSTVPADVTITVSRRDKGIRTEITSDRLTVEQSEKILIQDLVKAYLDQLNADIEVTYEDKIVCTFTFELVRKSGIVGHKHYKA